MQIKVGDLVAISTGGHNTLLGLVTEVTNPQYGLPPVYWIKFVDDGQEIRVQHTYITKVIR